MDFYDVIRKRRSIRAYQKRPVEDDKLQRILQAGRLAPTARNRQQFKIIVVTDAATRGALADGSDQPFLAQAPVVLAVVGLTPDALMHCRIPTDPVDCAIVSDHLILAATAEGLGTCWIGHFDQDACRRALGVPDAARIIELVPLGYAAEAPEPRDRKGLDELIRRERFS